MAAALGRPGEARGHGGGSVRAERHRIEPAAVARAQGRPQHPLALQGPCGPDSHGLVLGGGGQNLLVGAERHLPDGRRVEAAIQAQVAGRRRIGPGLGVRSDGGRGRRGKPAYEGFLRSPLHSLQFRNHLPPPGLHSALGQVLQLQVGLDRADQARQLQQQRRQERPLGLGGGAVALGQVQVAAQLQGGSFRLLHLGRAVVAEIPGADIQDQGGQDAVGPFLGGAVEGPALQPLGAVRTAGSQHLPQPFLALVPEGLLGGQVLPQVRSGGHPGGQRCGQEGGKQGVAHDPAPVILQRVPGPPGGSRPDHPGS